MEVKPEKIIEAFREELSRSGLEEDFKHSLLIQIRDNFVSPLREISAEYIKKLEDQSKDESGWVYIRDRIVLPFMLNFIGFATEKVLTKTIEGTFKE